MAQEETPKHLKLPALLRPSMRNSTLSGISSIEEAPVPLDVPHALPGDSEREPSSQRSFARHEEGTSQGQFDSMGALKKKKRRPGDTPRAQRKKELYTHHVHGKHKRFALNSCYFFSVKNKVRYAMVWLVEWPWFESAITLLILANSLFLGIFDYVNPEAHTWRNHLVIYSEPIFTTIFTLEAVMKIVAMGFITEQGCYLREAWNWLDFTVVITGLLSALPSFDNVSVLRTFRLFRPLRSLSTLRSMRLLVTTLLSSIVQLGGVLVLALFFFGVFAILGITLWEGLLYNRCRLTAAPTSPTTWPPVPDFSRACGNYQCGEAYPCGSLYSAYDEGLLSPATDFKADVQVSYLNYGVTNFDNIGFAVLTIFQCSTLQGWTDIMYLMQDAYSSWFASLYFPLVIIICSFFIMNLTVAVMLENFSRIAKDTASLQKKAKSILKGHNIDFQALAKKIYKGKTQKQNPLTSNAHLR